LDTAESWYDPVYYPLIQKMMMEAYALWDVDPNRVYLMGYSMGGWGTLHLCPSIPDYWAAGACSAGAGFTGPTGRSSPDNLRNLPMLIQVGAKDNAFNRRALSKIFAEAIKALQEKDKDGYIFEYKEHPNAEHSINDKDTPGWLAKFTRNSLPKKIVWQQLFPPLGNTKPEVDKLLAANPRISEFYRKQFYWLRNESPGSHQRLVASREENTITIEQAKHLDKASVLLNDRMADLDKPVRITSNGKELFAQVAPREVAVMIASLVERGDPEMIFSAEIPVSVPDSVEELEKKNLTDTNELLERVENRMTLGKYAEANQDAEAALTLGPKSGSKFYPYLYKIAELQKDPAAKIGVLRRWVPEASDNLMLVSEYSWECLTNVREDLRDLETGLEYAQKALTISGSNNPKTLNLLALAYFKNGKTQEAVDTQRKAVAALPANLPPVRAEPFKRQLKEFEDALKK
jgi:tetratricopeptide (TPR) repeat protein